MPARAAQPQGHLHDQIQPQTEHGEIDSDVLEEFDQTRANERLATKVDAFILSHSDRRNGWHDNDDDVDNELDL